MQVEKRVKVIFVGDKNDNYSATWLLVSLPRALLQLNNVFAHSFSLLNSFSKNVEKLFNESSSAEIRPPEVPEITLKIKLHGSARHVKLSHDIPGEKSEMNKYTRSRLVVVGPTTKTVR